MPSHDLFISVVASISNDGKVIRAFIEETIEVLSHHYNHYEVILVDDGSTDDSYQKMLELLNIHQGIRVTRLSRRFGEGVALSAGLDSAIGDFVVMLNPDTDPPALIPEMVERCRAGTGIVAGVRTQRGREPLWSRIGSGIFYWYARTVLRLNIPENFSRFHVLSRQVVNAISQVRDQHRYIALISNYVGYSQSEYPYQPINRSGKKQFRKFRESIDLALDIVISNSTHPLRMVTIIGLVASILNLCYVLYIVLIYIFKEKVMEGWATTNFQSAVMFFLVFTILTVLSEYVGRILNEVRRRPLYYVLEEKQSSVMFPTTARNVVAYSDEEERT